jgi:oxygen-independent coproporphyrinogen-3 oxidase
MDGYITKVVQDIAQCAPLSARLNAEHDRAVDSIYLGGGTPTTLAPDQLRTLFRAISDNFDVQSDSEVAVECAPGTLSPEILDTLLGCGTNRVSLGAQSFVDREAASVGRLHTAEQTFADIAHLRAAGIGNINIDLIAGLPHQTTASWKMSLEQLTASDVPHASIYMLEIDDDSRLGRELIAGGSRYHAHHVPDQDLTADLYVEAIEFLNSSGLQQYEISNFACPGCESRHNLKYWTRQPYLGFGVDAHSMLPVGSSKPNVESVRFGETDVLELYTAGEVKPLITEVSHREALEEKLFLGLRLNRGIDYRELEPQLDRDTFAQVRQLMDDGLLEIESNCLRLTSRGRLLSNEVFEQFITAEKLN